MVPLKEFTIDDKINEVADFLRHFWDALKPAEDEIKFLLTYPSTHPLILQVVSYHLFMNRQLGLDKKKLKKNFLVPAH
ncbi:MAG: hypothetical protein JXJ04_02830 [Spirochaetales bacterium]|nr:hypothetical protein [Spirochaetales bacterium]